MTAPAIAVIDIDLRRPMPAVANDAARLEVQLVFWAEGIPLGTRTIGKADLPLSAAQVLEIAIAASAPALGWHLFGDGFEPSPPDSPPPQRRAPDLAALAALEAPLDQLARLRRSTAPPMAGLCVIVCTRDRPQHLERCLQTLHRLDPRPAEIIVVDNAPTSEMTRRLVEAHPGIRYVREPRPGLSVARNAGICASSAEIIAFTDDDVIVPLDWARRLSGAFTLPEVMAVTGLVLSAPMDTKAQAAFHRLLAWGTGDFRPIIYDPTFMASTRRRGTPTWRFGAGANMAFRREVFDRVGLFDERLGAGAAGCSEDSEVWYRILAAGYACRCDPTVYVHHIHRDDMPALRRQIRAYMRGHVTALLILGRAHRDLGYYRRVALQLPRYFFRRLASGARHCFLGEHALVFTQIAGSLAGIGFYVRHCRGRTKLQ